jgi:hypothetical protein
MRSAFAAVAILFILEYSCAMSHAEELAIPALEGQAPTSIHQTESDLELIFGPVDLSVPFDGHPASVMPRLTFELERDIAIIGYSATVSASGGTPIAQKYLHHISVLNLDKASSFCKGAKSLVAGAGMEMNEVRFPAGYAIHLKKGTRLMGLASFYHGMPPLKGAVATLRLRVAAPHKSFLPLETYHVSVNVDCFTDSPLPGRPETDEGIVLSQGLAVHTRSVHFSMGGCVKLVSPHGHDHLVLMTLENKTKRRTLLRTVPTVQRDGSLMAFRDDQVYADSAGFDVTPDDEYSMMMVYYRSLEDRSTHHGMADYLMYMTPDPCPFATAAP